MRIIYILFVVFLIQKSDASNLCDEENCVQKCCPENNYLFRGKCKLFTEKTEFKEVNVYNNTKLYNNSNEFQLVGHLNDFFKIKGGAYLEEKFHDNDITPYGVLYKFNKYYLMENGSMFFLGKNSTELHEFTRQEYCIDNRFLNETTLSKDLAIWIINKSKQDIIKWGLLVSCVFLLLVLVVYSLLPELRNLCGLILMAYVTSQLLGFAFLFTIKSGSRKSPITCLTITCLTVYFLLASFCWLNVMSYDIWWTFRGYAKARSINRRGENVKFLMYCVYGFGVPLGITIAVATLNQLNLKNRLPGIVPKIPDMGCFIDTNAKLAYLYAPMMIMIVANWTFFTMTAFNIWRLSCDSGVLRSADSGASGSSSARNNNKQRLFVYLKLSVIMGLSWILEVVSSFYPEFEGWYISDCYNILIGVFIFVIFVCKKKIFNKLKKRYTNFKRSHKFSFQSKGQTRSRSSQDESTQSQSIPLQTQNSTVSSK